MDNKRKRKLDKFLEPTVKAPSALKIKREKAEGKSWAALSKFAQEHVGSVFQHTYTLKDGTEQRFESTHTHGEFSTRLQPVDPKTMQLEKFNISTASSGASARSFKKLLDSFGSKHKGATNAMRVLKGTHAKYFLTTGDTTKAESAVELAAEIGISEYSRGGTHALVNAMSGLYLMKHGQMKRKEFNDPKIGYIGAGQGGAERLRTLQQGGLTDALHLKRLRSVYDTYASKKTGKAWSGKSADEGFDIWLKHKATKWTQRQ